SNRSRVSSMAVFRFSLTNFEYGRLIQQINTYVLLEVYHDCMARQAIFREGRKSFVERGLRMRNKDRLAGSFVTMPAAKHKNNIEDECRSKTRKPSVTVKIAPKRWNTVELSSGGCIGLQRHESNSREKSRHTQTDAG